MLKGAERSIEQAIFASHRLQAPLLPAPIDRVAMEKEDPELTSVNSKTIKRRA